RPGSRGQRPSGGGNLFQHLHDRLQEIISDPSYAGQIITFTFPHIGNVGANHEDVETTTPAARGVVLRAPVTDPASWRAIQRLDSWLASNNLPGIAGVD